MGRKSRAKREQKNEKSVESPKRFANAIRYGDRFESISQRDVQAIFPNLAKRGALQEAVAAPQQTHLPPVSDQLTDFGEPLSDILNPESTAELKHCYMMVAMIWNSLRVPPDKSSHKLNDLLTGFRARFGDAVYQQMIRRNKSFENDPRIVVDVNVIERGGEAQLLVASTFPSESD